jgi:hypothetical protein
MRFKIFKWQNFANYGVHLLYQYHVLLDLQMNLQNKRVCPDFNVIKFQFLPFADFHNLTCLSNPRERLPLPWLCPTRFAIELANKRECPDFNVIKFQVLPFADFRKLTYSCIPLDVCPYHDHVFPRFHLFWLIGLIGLIAVRLPVQSCFAPVLAVNLLKISWFDIFISQ